MSASKNSAGATAAPAAEKPEVVETITNLYTKSVERIAEVQKKGIDLAVKQNAELIDAYKKVAQTVPGASGLLILDLAANAFERYADTQKGAIDLVLEQSHALVGLAKERIGATAEAAEGAKAVVQQTVEQSVAAQKKALDYSAAQGKAAFAAAKQQFGLAGTPAESLADSLERGVDQLVATQKELLDLAAKPLASVK
jgi:hypothetical protein